jgi:hypothetical protein
LKAALWNPYFSVTVALRELIILAPTFRSLDHKDKGTALGHLEVAHQLTLAQILNLEWDPCGWRPMSLVASRKAIPAG